MRLEFLIQSDNLLEWLIFEIPCPELTSDCVNDNIWECDVISDDVTV